MKLFEELQNCYKSKGENMFKKIVAFSLMLVMMLPVAPAINTEAAINKASYKSYKQAGVEARDKVYAHNSRIVAKIKSKSADPQTLFSKFEKVVYAETSNPNQGDFMKWDVDETATDYSAVKSGSYYYYTFILNIDYLTTVKQRNTLDKKVNSIIKDFKFTNKTSTYDKIKKVYDYVCENVSYAKNASSDDTKYYSAYQALIGKKAVCQGYATLLYKFYRTLGISARVIAGQSTFSKTSHGWNIVKLGNYYYNVDSTWDSTLTHAKKDYEYFLKGDSFKGHARWKEYNSYSFYYNYPMAAKGYSKKTVAKACKKTKIANFKNKKPKFTSVSRKQAKFKKIKNATYQIKYSTVNTFKKKYTVVKNTKKTKYKFKSLKTGVIYYVKYRARKKIGSKKYYSKWSVVKVIQ